MKLSNFSVRGAHRGDGGEKRRLGGLKGIFGELTGIFEMSSCLEFSVK